MWFANNYVVKNCMNRSSKKNPVQKIERDFYTISAQRGINAVLNLRCFFQPFLQKAVKMTGGVRAASFCALRCGV